MDALTDDERRKLVGATMSEPFDENTPPAIKPLSSAEVGDLVAMDNYGAWDAATWKVKRVARVSAQQIVLSDGTRVRKGDGYVIGGLQSRRMPRVTSKEWARTHLERVRLQQELKKLPMDLDRIPLAVLRRIFEPYQEWRSGTETDEANE